jgi:acyl carrier protein
LGAFTSSGQLTCLGRRDQQIKIRGQRVELEEIESCLETDTRIAVVSVVDPTASQSRLIAAFECDQAFNVPVVDSRNIENATDDMIRELERRARSRLPSYMVPSVFLALPRLPTTPNGKVDRAKLQKDCLERYLNMQKAEHTDGREQIMTATEKKLHSTIKEFFGIAHVGLHEDLFTRVLDSLSSMSLAAHLRNLYSAPLRLNWVLENRTVHQLAAVIDSPYSQGYNSNASELYRMPPTIKFPRVKPEVASQILFCVHPASGLANVFHHLAVHLPDIEVVGINDPYFGDDNVYKDVCAMAEQYVSNPSSSDDEPI